MAPKIGLLRQYFPRGTDFSSISQRHLNAGEYIAALPAKEQKETHWEAAAKALMLVVESNGDARLARIGVMRVAQPRF